MQVNSSEYQKHVVFKNLEQYIQFYDDWSFRVFGFSTIGTTAIANLDSALFSSMKGTMDSIRMLLQSGRINDAYALLRKFYDCIYINVYITLYTKDNVSVENLIVKQVQDWFQGTEQLPSIRTISDYIRKHKKLAEINNIIFKYKTYAELRDRCNDNTHYNFFKNVLLNDNEIYSSKRDQVLNDISEDITHLVIMHLSLIFYLSEHYMASTDYLDHLEFGQTPPEDSQYWVSTFVQNIFDGVIKKYRPDIAKYIKNVTVMDLE